MKTIRRIVEIISNTLTVLVIIAIFFALYGFFQIKVLNKTHINYFGFTIFEVVSGSMAPTINTYDLVVVKLTKDVKEDDIITFYSQNNFITHRVIDYKDDNNILTKGDANNATDKSINKKMIVGKVIYTLEKFGIYKRSLSDSKVAISIFSTIILFSVAFSITNKKEDKNEKEDIKISEKE